MRVLLDTHSLLWYLNDDASLSMVAKSVINDPVNDVLVSIVSLWEIAIKTSLGKLSISQPFAEFIPKQIVENQFDILSISLEHLAQVTILPFHHRDPFDRLLIAQSLIENISIVGRDSVFKTYGASTIW